MKIKVYKKKQSLVSHGDSLGDIQEKVKIRKSLSVDEEILLELSTNTWFVGEIPPLNPTQLEFNLLWRHTPERILEIFHSLLSKGFFIQGEMEDGN